MRKCEKLETVLPYRKIQHALSCEFIISNVWIKAEKILNVVNKIAAISMCEAFTVFFLRKRSIL